jgi:hypothetical protein
MAASLMAAVTMPSAPAWPNNAEMSDTLSND